MPRPRSIDALVPELIDAIYGAALHPQQWPESVDRILSAFGGSSAMLYTPTVVYNQGGFLASKQVSARHLTDYTQHCHPENDWFQAWARQGAPAPVVVTGDMLLDRRVVHRSRLFNEFLKPLEMYDMCTAVLYNGQQDGFPPVFCTIFRGRTDSDFKPREVQLMRQLTPHLRRALEMSRVLAQKEAGRRAGFAVLEQLQVGVLLVNAVGQVVFANPKAESLMRLNDGLRVVGGRVQAEWPKDTEALERLIHGALRQGGDAVIRAQPLALPRPSYRPPFLVTAAPLPRIHSFLVGPNHPAAALFLADSASQPPVTARRLMGAYDLTAAEASVAMRLLEGLTPRGIASAHALRITTVRTHLARIFMKTHTSRQADFVRKVFAELGPPAPRGPMADPLPVLNEQKPSA